LAGTFTPINCIATDCTDGFSGTLTNEDYNISDVASDLAGAHSQNGVEPTYLDKDNDNFLLSPTDTIAINMGTNDPGSGLYSTDVLGITRVSPWDIGFSEVPVSTRSCGFLVGL
jgi:hypothetical protein